MTGRMEQRVEADHRRAKSGCSRGGISIAAKKETPPFGSVGPAMLSLGWLIPDYMTGLLLSTAIWRPSRERKC